MTTKRLTPSGNRSETRFLQPLFNDWRNRGTNTTSGRVIVAGAPDWLLRVQCDNAGNSQFAGYGCSFRPDVLWRLRDERRVIELKDAWKYEPIALIEVLHHARLIGLVDSVGKGPVKPTVVCRYNSWSRGALQDLVEHGLRPDYLEYLEFEHLTDGPEHYLWLDEPFAPWRPETSEQLRAMLGDVSPGWECWYRIDRTDSWIGTHQDLGTTRPVFIEVPYVMVSRIEGKNNEFLAWEGTPPPLRSDSGHNWNDRFEKVSR